MVLWLGLGIAFEGLGVVQVGLAVVWVGLGVVCMGLGVLCIGLTVVWVGLGVAWIESAALGMEPVEVRGEGMGLWVEPIGVEVRRGTLLIGLTALYAEVVVVCAVLGNSEEPASEAL